MNPTFAGRMQPATYHKAEESSDRPFVNAKMASRRKYSDDLLNFPPQLALLHEFLQVGGQNFSTLLFIAENFGPECFRPCGKTVNEPHRHSSQSAALEEVSVVGKCVISLRLRYLTAVGYEFIGMLGLKSGDDKNSIYAGVA